VEIAEIEHKRLDARDLAFRDQFAARCSGPIERVNGGEMDRRTVQTLLRQRLEGLDKEWNDLDSLAEEAQLEVKGLAGTEIRIGVLGGSKEKTAWSVRGSEVSGLNTPLRLEEHGVGASVSVGAGSCSGTIRAADSALKDSTEGAAQDVAANFKWKMEPGCWPQLEEEASDAQRRSGVKERCGRRKG